MTFRKMLIVAVALLITASPLSALQTKPVDLTGVWTGTFTPSDGGPGGAHIDLTQKGAEVTGTAGPRAEQQVPISNGKVMTVKNVTSVTFDATQPNGVVLKFNLTLADGRLKGKANAESPSGEKREAAVDVGRAK